MTDDRTAALRRAADLGLEYVEGLTEVTEAISKSVVFAPNGNIEAQGIFLFEVKDGEFAPLIATDEIPAP